MIKSSKGFSLIELMIVIVIIGILAALCTSRFTQEDAKQLCRKNLNRLSAAEEEYFKDLGSYTNDFSALERYLPNARFLRCPADSAAGEYIVGADSLCYSIVCPSAKKFHGSVGCGD